VQSDIIRKLREHLDLGVDTECEAVYLLCEVRKILEAWKREKRPRPATLKMFCDWALHVDLTYESTTKHFLERIDDALKVLLGGTQTGETMARENALFRELAHFETFRTELGAFLREYGLPTDLCDDSTKWASFLEAYAGVIEDGSLCCMLDWVERVTFSTDDRAVMDGSDLRFRVIWMVVLKREYRGFRKVEVSVSGRADRQMLSWGYGLRN
jgi:hypothetical protein